MNDEMLEIEDFVIFSCARTDKVLLERENIRTDDLRSVKKEIEDIFEKLAVHKRSEYSRSYSRRLARIYSFSDQHIEQFCDEMLSSESEMSFGETAKKLVWRYYQTQRSQKATLLILRAQVFGKHFLVILSYEYMMDADPATEKKIKEVFFQHPRKVIIYPYCDFKRDIQRGIVLVIQKGYYAGYWWNFLDLMPIYNWKDIERLLSLSDAGLNREFARYMPRIRKELFTKDKLRKKICSEWGIIEIMDKPKHKDKIELVIALTDMISVLEFGIPPVMIAVLIAKIGIRDFCKDYNKILHRVGEVPD